MKDLFSNQNNSTSKTCEAETERENRKNKQIFKKREKTPFPLSSHFMPFSQRHVVIEQGNNFFTERKQI